MTRRLFINKDIVEVEVKVKSILGGRRIRLIVQRVLGCQESNSRAKFDAVSGGIVKCSQNITRIEPKVRSKQAESKK